MSMGLGMRAEDGRSTLGLTSVLLLPVQRESQGSSSENGLDVEWSALHYCKAMGSRSTPSRQANRRYIKRRSWGPFD